MQYVTKTQKDLIYFLKRKKNSILNNWIKKIRSLRSSNSKEYWSLLNRSTEGKKKCPALCLQTFMNHFKQLSQKMHKILVVLARRRSQLPPL